MNPLGHEVENKQANRLQQGLSKVLIAGEKRICMNVSLSDKFKYHTILLQGSKLFTTRRIFQGFIIFGSEILSYTSSVIMPWKVFIVQNMIKLACGCL